jgi:Salmonella virulence plasmid 65kDa B protein
VSDADPPRWWFAAQDRNPRSAGAEDADPAGGPPPDERSRPRDRGPGTRPTGAGSLPSISLPKGGGAIGGIDEKLSISQPTGTASLTVGVFTSPARQGFGPELALSYDSGAGNDPFGLGWSLGVPAITRKTSMGLPRYEDASDSDVFILSGAEDLVPLLVNTDGAWGPAVLPPQTIGTSTYLVKS